jgi:hypothetical protein
VPCWESATAVSLVMRARRVAELTTKTSGLRWCSTMIDRGADGAQVVRARPGRDDHEVGVGDDLDDRGGDGRRRVDDDQPGAVVAEVADVWTQIGDGGLGEGRRRRLARVPPLGEAPLGIGVDDGDGSRAGHFGLDRDMPRERGLARAALLRSQDDDLCV